jgi:hypothetical protein
MNNRLSGYHFGKQQRIRHKMAVKDTAMPVSPIHHRCNTKAAVNAVGIFLHKFQHLTKLLHVAFKVTCHKMSHNSNLLPNRFVTI